MNLSINDRTKTVFEIVSNFLAEMKLAIASYDDARPWGGFFVLDESEANHFISIFFPHLSNEELNISGKLSPKILVVAPHKRLSWQYHHRRAEIWKLIGGEAAVMVSDTDEENEIISLNKGDIIELKQGERHRLIGTENWGIIAEIWLIQMPITQAMKMILYGCRMILGGRSPSLPKSLQRRDF